MTDFLIFHSYYWHLDRTLVHMHSQTFWIFLQFLSCVPLLHQSCKYLVYLYIEHVPSVLWHCWSGVRKSVWPVKIELITRPAPYHSVFYRPDALPAAQPTASKHWKQNQVSLLKSNLFYSLFSDRQHHCLSVLTLLVGRQEEHLACDNWVVRCWCGCLSGVRCRLCAYGPADVTASQNPIISCLI